MKRLIGIFLIALPFLIMFTGMFLSNWKMAFAVIGAVGLIVACFVGGVRLLEQE